MRLGRAASNQPPKHSSTSFFAIRARRSSNASGRGRRAGLADALPALPGDAGRSDATTALAPGPQHPGRPHGWRNGWRNGSQVTTPPGLPAASPTELGGGRCPQRCLMGVCGLQMAHPGVGRETCRDETCCSRWTPQALPSPALLIPSPLWLPPQAEPRPPPTSQHHTNRPPLTTTDGPDEQEWCPSVPHNSDATWSWPGAC